jgi:hypothetical protein
MHGPYFAMRSVTQSQSIEDLSVLPATKSAEHLSKLYFMLDSLLTGLALKKVFIVLIA